MKNKYFKTIFYYYSIVTITFLAVKDLANKPQFGTYVSPDWHKILYIIIYKN